MDRQHQVVIKFTGDTAQAEASMQRLKTEMAAVGAEVIHVDNTVRRMGQGFVNVNQVTIKSTASLTDLRQAVRAASTGIISAGATLDQYKIKTDKLRISTLEAAEAARKAAIEQERLNKEASGLSVTHVLMYSSAYMAASTAITGFLAAVASVPELGMKLQTTESGLLGVYQNQALVNEQLGFLSRLADEAGVKVTTLRDAYISFTASALKAGTTVEDAQKQFENYTKTARALNLSDQNFQGMLLAIQQILSKGRIMSEELQGQLGEHIPAAVALMAKSMGVTTMELRKMMEQGKLTSLEMQRFSDVLFNEFSKGYEASVNNLSAETARFSNAWDEVATNVFKATEGIMSDVVNLSTGALHQLNETLQSTTDYITALDGKHIRFSVEPKVTEDLGFIERTLTNIEGILNKSADGWLSAFSKWGADFDKLKASMDFGLDKAVFGNVTDQFRDYETVTQNIIQANASLSGGFEVLQKGTEKQAITLKDELAVALRNYNQQAAEMLHQMEDQEKVIANLNKSGQSSTGETASLAESKKSYEELMGVITNYADLFVRTNQKIGNASNEAKAALNTEAKLAAEGVRSAEAEASADKAAKTAKKAKLEVTIEAGKVLNKHGELVQGLVEKQATQTIELTKSAVAAQYFADRLHGLSDAEARLSAETNNSILMLKEQQKIRIEGETATAGLRTKYLAGLKEAGITDNVQKEITGVKSRTDEVVQAQLDFKRAVDETTERLKLQAETAKKVAEAIRDSTSAEANVSTSTGTGTAIVKAGNATPSQSKVDEIAKAAEKHPQVITVIDKVAKETGNDPAVMRTMAYIESRFNASAYNPKSGASGTYQFVGKTAEQYGLSGKQMDAESNTRAYVKLLDDNAKALKTFGIEVTGANLYLAHQQGAQGLADAYKVAQGGTLSAKDAARLQSNMRSNPSGGDDSTAAKFLANWTADYNTLEASVNAAIPAVGTVAEKTKEVSTETQQVTTEVNTGTQAVKQGVPIWDTINTATESTKDKTTKLADVTVEYKGKLQAVTTELTTQTLADQYMTEQTRQRVVTAQQELKLVGLTGEAAKEQKLIQDEFNPSEAHSIQTAEQTLEFERERVALAKELQNIRNPGMAAQYAAGLSSDKNLTKDHISTLTGLRMENQFQSNMRDLDGRAEKATMTAKAYEHLTMAREGFTQAQIAGQMGWEKEVKRLEDARQFADELGTVLHDEVKGSLKDIADTGMPIVDKFIDRLIEATIEAMHLGDALQFSSNLGSNGGGGILSSIASSLFGGGGGGSGSASIPEIKLFANGDTFHNSILTKPTEFTTSGKPAVAGERGAEAVMPMPRGGVIAQTAGGVADLPVIRIGGKLAVDARKITKSSVNAAYASGDVFNKNNNEVNGRIAQYASGDSFHNQILTQPIFFRGHGGELSVAGEAGKEAVMPMPNGGILAKTETGVIDLPTTRVGGKLAVDARVYAEGDVFGVGSNSSSSNKQAGTTNINVSIPVTIDAKGADSNSVQEIQQQLVQFQKQLARDIPLIIRQAQINQRVRPSV
jgi:tape measure domain-containing protein